MMSGPQRSVVAVIVLSLTLPARVTTSAEDGTASQPCPAPRRTVNILDPTVHPDWQKRGIGRALVRRAAAVARKRGIEWLHVDFESHMVCDRRPTYNG